MRFYIFTVWYWPEGYYLGPVIRRKIMRLPGRVDLPNHEDIKENVRRQLEVNTPDVRVEFGPISEAKDQGSRL